MGRRPARPPARPALGLVAASGGRPRLGPWHARFDTMTQLGHDVSDVLLDDYAAALRGIAEREVSSVAGGEPAVSTERAIVGTVVLEPVILLIRRMAHEHVSTQLLRHRRGGAPPDADPGVLSDPT